MSAYATAAAWFDVYAIAEKWDQGSCSFGVDFLDKFSAILTVLESFPRLYGRVKRAPRGREIRCARIGNTMYLAVYEVRDDHARVFSVYHAHQKYAWRRRL